MKMSSTMLFHKSKFRMCTVVQYCRPIQTTVKINGQVTKKRGRKGSSKAQVCVVHCLQRTGSHVKERKEIVNGNDEVAGYEDDDP